MYCHSLGGRSGLDTVEIAAVDMRCGDVPTEIITHKYKVDSSKRIKWSPSKAALAGILRVRAFVAGEPIGASHYR